jgi:hypothetical protein
MTLTDGLLIGILVILVMQNADRLADWVRLQRRHRAKRRGL